MALKPLKPPVYIPLHDGWRLYAVAADTTTRRGALVTFEPREGDDQVLRNTKTLCLADDAQTLLAADQFATLCDVAKVDIHRGFLNLLDAINHPAPQENHNALDNGTACPYEATEHGIVWRKPTQHGAVPVQLTNFMAETIADTLIDDGAEAQHTFTVQARLE